jgi:hypothetical protein
VTEPELLYISMLANLAMLECHFEGRPFCIFNHPEHPGMRFEIGSYEPSPTAWRAPAGASQYLH